MTLRVRQKDCLAVWPIGRRRLSSTSSVYVLILYLPVTAGDDFLTPLDARMPTCRAHCSNSRNRGRWVFS